MGTSLSITICPYFRILFSEKYLLLFSETETQDKERQNSAQNIGSELMTYIKRTLHENQLYAAFRFITVDAYMSAIPFYEKNDFRLLVSSEENP